MSGYANRTIRLPFPELAEPADDVWVVIRNPKLVPADEVARDDIPLGPDGKPGAGATARVGYELMAKLIIGWHAYDASWVPQLDPQTGEPLPGQEQPLLPSPATAESVARLPGEILCVLGEELRAAFPQMPTGAPADGTSRTSSPSPSPGTTAPGPDPSPSLPS